MAARPYLMPIDMTGNEIQNAKLHNLGSAPSSPVGGRYYYDTTSNRFLYYNGTAFVNLATDSDKLGGQLPAYYTNRANQTGTQTASTISDLPTVVQAYRLDQFSAPTGSLNINNQRLTNVGTPTAGTDAATKQYVDALAQGQDPKPSANWATAAALPANTYANGTAGVGATITANANGALAVDGGAPAAGDRVLVLNEATTQNRGLYVVTNPGSGAAPFVLTRDTTMDQATEFGGALIAVEGGGTANGNTLWLCNAAESITVGTTGLSFVKLNASTALNGSTSILISGNAASVIVKASGGRAQVRAGGRRRIGNEHRRHPQPRYARCRDSAVPGRCSVRHCRVRRPAHFVEHGHSRVQRCPDGRSVPGRHSRVSRAACQRPNSLASASSRSPRPPRPARTRAACWRLGRLPPTACSLTTGRRSCRSTYKEIGQDERSRMLTQLRRRTTTLSS